LNKKGKKKGQIAIMLAMSFSLLALLIAMVVNISFLVTAKINLQNAVDLAAYAGAAQQARYLTEIGKWNYEMRRNYKAMIFDYMITYNAERKTPDFKKYINNIGGTQYPVVCASLQRQAGATPPDTANLEQPCVSIPYNQFQTAVNQALAVAAQTCTAAQTACTAGSSTCAAMQYQCNQAYATAQQLFSTSTHYGDKYKNYEDPATNNYNYNLRLMGWALHAYRNMQARIRGVHYGDITLGKMSNPAGSRGRWDLIKNDNVKIFKNSPISVAAKVINGYTDPGKIESDLKDKKYIELNSSTTSLNPMHNAAYTTFRNNLLKVLSSGNAKIFHILPSVVPAATFQSKDMAMGCGTGSETCFEYTGPYLRLQQHDVGFQIQYMIIVPLSPPQGGGTLQLRSKNVNNFPVGVLKDNRIWTYYAVVGVADTTSIPFKVFFGSKDSSDSPPLIAIAAARPFGSRIGPYIDDACSDMQATNAVCNTSNGRDPLYPTSTSNGIYPNFSILETGDDKFLGVKLTVNETEFGIPAAGIMSGTPQSSKNPTDKTDLYAKTYGKGGRDRLYTRAKGSEPYNADDGFNAVATEPDFFDNDNNPIPPQGNRNSIFAWKSPVTATAPSGTPEEKDSFEAYLKQFKGSAIYWFSQQDAARKYGNNSDYSMYVFKYPSAGSGNGSTGGNWDIEGLTLLQASNTTYLNSMEKAFANAMAVSEFEIKRYIIPYSNVPNKKYLNYITSANNNKAYIYAGEVNRGSGNPKGTGNKPFADNAGQTTAYAKKESNPYPDVLAPDDTTTPFPESYTAWRIGSRGYRVKLVNIQDLLASDISGGANLLQNPLPSTITITSADLNITIDLQKVAY